MAELDQETGARTEDRRPASAAQIQTVGMASTSAADIIPRMMLAHASGREGSEHLGSMCGHVPASGSSASWSASASALDTFTEIVLTRETEDAAAWLSALVDSGVDVQTVFLDLLAPCARRLGEYWEMDRCSFTEVTVGLGRLQRLLHQFGASGGRWPNPGVRTPTALFVSARDEQHSFGVLMVDEIFRRHGWRTVCEPSAGMDTMRQLVGSQWFDVIGVSVSCEAHVEAASRLIGLARGSAANPGALIMVGGGVFKDRTDLTSLAGADVTDWDGTRAMGIAQAAHADPPLTA